MRINVKAKMEKTRTAYEYAKCDNTQKEEHNKASHNMKNPSQATYENTSKSMKQAAEQRIPKIEKHVKKDHLTKEAENIIMERERAWKQGEHTIAKRLTYNLRKQMRKDRRQRIIDMVSQDLDTPSQWMGISWIKKGYQPIPYTLKTEEGKGSKRGTKQRNSKIPVEKHGANKQTAPPTKKINQK